MSALMRWAAGARPASSRAIVRGDRAAFAPALSSRSSSYRIRIPMKNIIPLSLISAYLDNRGLQNHLGGMEGLHVENQDAPENLLDGAWDRLSRIPRFTCRDTDHLSASIESTYYHTLCQSNTTGDRVSKEIRMNSPAMTNVFATPFIPGLVSFGTIRHLLRGEVYCLQMHLGPSSI